MPGPKADSPVAEPTKTVMGDGRHRRRGADMVDHTQHGEITYTCPDCKQYYESGILPVAHIEQQSGPGADVFRCRDCAARLPAPRSAWSTPCGRCSAPAAKTRAAPARHGPPPRRGFANTPRAPDTADTSAASPTRCSSTCPAARAARTDTPHRRPAERRLTATSSPVRGPRPRAGLSFALASTSRWKDGSSGRGTRPSGDVDTLRTLITEKAPRSIRTRSLPGL